jgi:hypothetical protein
MSDFGYGGRMSSTGRVKVGEGMVIARGETETGSEVTGTRLEEDGIGLGGDGTGT